MHPFIALVLGVALTGCGGSITTAPADLSIYGDIAQPEPFCTDGVDGGPPPNFASVERILKENCATAFCHDGGTVGSAAKVMMDLRPGHAYATLVGADAVEKCGGKRVIAGNAAASYLLHKLVDEMPCEGSQMPLSEVGPFPLPRCATDLIKTWIQSGAPK